jgi:hypothetical protein
MKPMRVVLAGAALLLTSLALAQATAPEPAPAKKLSYTDDYRISVDDDADSDGEIIFRVTPKKGVVTEVRVEIKKGTNENAIAREIKKAFVEQLGTRHYNIEMESGENVVIERSMGSENISLVLVSSTVKGVDIKVHRD